MASSRGLPSYGLPGTSHSLYVPPSPTNNSDDGNGGGGGSSSAQNSGYHALFAPPILPSNTSTSSAPTSDFTLPASYGVIDPALLLFGQQHVVTPPRVEDHQPSYGYGTGSAVAAAAAAGGAPGINPSQPLMNATSLDPTLLIARDNMQLDGVHHQNTRSATRESSRRNQPKPTGLAPPSAPLINTLPDTAQEQGDGADGGADEDQALYCICKKKDDGSPMVECAACEDWFHLRCVGLSKRAVDRLESYTCPACSEKIALAKSNSKQASKNKKGTFKSPPPSDRSSPVDSEADSVYEPPEEVPSSTSTSLKRKSQSDDVVSKKAKTSPPPAATQRSKVQKQDSVMKEGGMSEYQAERRKAAAAKAAAAASSSSVPDIKSMHDPTRDPVRKHCIEQFTAILTAIFAEQTALTASTSASTKEKESTAAAAKSTAGQPASKSGRPAFTYAATLEHALFKLHCEPVPGKPHRFQAGKAYKDRFRSLIFSFKDKTNQALRRRIVAGELPAPRLARMSNAELANDEMRLKTERARLESLASSILKKEEVGGVVRKMTHKGEVEVERADGREEQAGGGGGTTTSTRTERSSSMGGKVSLMRPHLVKKESGSSSTVSSPVAGYSSAAGTPQPTAANGRAAGQSATSKLGPGPGPGLGDLPLPLPLPSFARKAPKGAQRQASAASPTSESGSVTPAPATGSSTSRFNFGSLWTGSPTSEQGGLGDEDGSNGKDEEGGVGGGGMGAETASPAFSAQDGGMDLGHFGASDDLIDNFLDESSSASAAAPVPASAAPSILKKPTPSAPLGPRARGGPPTGPKSALRAPPPGPPPPPLHPKSAMRASGSQTAPAVVQRSTTPPKLPNVPLKRAGGSMSSAPAGPSHSHPPAGILKQSKPTTNEPTKFPSTKVWSGALSMPEQGTFSGHVRQIGGRPLGPDPRIWPLFFPESHTTIEGRLPSGMAEEYLVASTAAHRTEVVAFVLERGLCLPALAVAGDEAPLTEEGNTASFERVVGYFAGRGRYGVLGSAPSARGRIIKDFYIAALPKNMSVLPRWLTGLVPGLESFEPSLQYPRVGLGSRSEDVFVLAAVLFKGALDAELAMGAPGPPIPAMLGMSYGSSSSAGPVVAPADPLAGLLGAGGASALQDLLASVGAAGGAPPPSTSSSSSSSSAPAASSSSAQAALDSVNSSSMTPAVTMPASTASALANVPTEKLEPLLLANPTLVDQLLASLKEGGHLNPAVTTSTSTAGPEQGQEEEAYVPSSGIPAFAALAGRSGFPPPGPAPPPPPPPPGPAPAQPWDASLWPAGGGGGYEGHGHGPGGYGPPHRGRGGYGRGGGGGWA
ncbi:unnamed protein product [Tilletia controversa]|uniref:Transcription factor BYE1 n=1 Tax=Tilletia controversa TaxID=13291 RepID=A0A8X7MSB1_9BASI|nr:hypothetical protein CF328_g5022 [Tilletia controversa]KAE8247261.1 hypothetical protein A4X06_0g4584 [Tilletia controversa]CAD6933508.1 unnamed protein product [Tilletia controversa]CAD6967604.1 unnamed protein product [Tilletia controversa]